MISTATLTIFLFIIVFLFVALLITSRSITERFLRVAQQADGDPVRQGVLSRLRANFEKLIQASGFDLFPNELISLMVIVGVLGCVLALNFDFNMILALMVGLIASCLPVLFLVLKKNKNIEKLDQQMGEAMPMIASNLRTGLSLRQSLIPVGDAMGNPIKEELEQFRADVAKGFSTAEAIHALAERTQSEDMAMFASAIKVQEEHGGSIADVIDQVGATIRERSELRLMIKTKTGTAKISVYVMIAVPILVGIVLCMTNEIYSSFYTTPIGFMVIGGCAFSMFIGYMIMRKIADIRV